MPLAAKLQPGSPKRLLALDGGGIRGLITIEILAKLEHMLRERLGAGPDFRLVHYFDYIAGTSSGAILATCLALGMSAEELRSFTVANGMVMFDKAGILRRARYKYENARLGEMLRETFNARLPDDERRAGKTDVTLGSAALQSLLLVVMRNATTDSPWPISNNPRAMFNARERDDCNLDIPLWQLVRASTAAPTYFPPEEVRVGDRSFLFVDGGVTAYDNPSFLLFLMATVSAYRLEWPVGADNMLLVSIGTGITPGADAKLTAHEMNLLYNAASVPSALILASLMQQDMLCRVFGRCRAGDAIDSEVGTLIPGDDEVRRVGIPKLFTYLRYNAELTREGLDRLGLPKIQPENVLKLDSVQHMAELQAVGRRVADGVSAEHFAGFVPAPSPVAERA
jgi:uncharacterized protein